MRALIAAMMFCCYGLAFASGEPLQPVGQQVAGPEQSVQHQQQSASTQQKPDDDQRGSEQTPLVVKVYKAKESDGETDQEQEQEQEDRAERASADSRMFWIGVFTLVILIVQAAVFFWQGRQLKRTVKEMEGATTTAAQMRDATQRQTRAYVYLADVSTRLYAKPNSNVLDTCRFWFEWKNSGVTPATECAMWTGFLKIGIHSTAPVNFTKGGRIPVTLPLGPMQKISSSSECITADDLMDIFCKKARGYIWGRAEYRDVFFNPDDPVRHTEICSEVIVDSEPSNPGKPAIVRFQGTHQHNSSS